VNDSLEQFRDLALRALDRPADAALRDELAAQLSAHPEWAGEWRELRETHRVVREAAHAADALTEADRTEHIPAARLAALLGEDLDETAPAATRPRRSHRWRWLGLVAGITLIASTALLVQRPSNPAASTEIFDVTPWLAHAPPTLTRALTAPLSNVVASAQLPTLRTDASLQLRSPLLATSAGEVTVTWRGDVAATITLREGGRIVWSATDARSGARTPALPADRVYELVLTPTNGTPVRERFVTVAPASDTAGAGTSGFATLLGAITTEPARLGDAVTAWHALPEEARRSEIGVRLGLWLGVEARQPDLLAEAKASAELRARAAVR
jgi:hypothetical protein